MITITLSEQETNLVRDGLAQLRDYIDQIDESGAKTAQVDALIERIEYFVDEHWKVVLA